MDRGVNQLEKETGGCFKCSSRCDLCKNFLIQDSKFKSFSTGRTYKINQNLSCSSKNVVFLASCIKCNLQYVFAIRSHPCARTKKTCKLAVHFNCTEHEISEINFIVIEKITSQGDVAYIDRTRLGASPTNPGPS